jgi:hypothetical protein
MNLREEVPPQDIAEAFAVKAIAAPNLQLYLASLARAFAAADPRLRALQFLVWGQDLALKEHEQWNGYHIQAANGSWSLRPGARPPDFDEFEVTAMEYARVHGQDDGVSLLSFTCNRWTATGGGPVGALGEVLPSCPRDYAQAWLWGYYARSRQLRKNRVNITNRRNKANAAVGAPTIAIKPVGPMPPPQFPLMFLNR